MKLKLYTAASLFLFLFIFACQSKKYVVNSPVEAMSLHEQQFLDSVLTTGLDREALYTLLGDIKPMSSLTGYSFQLANTDSALKTSSKVVDVEARAKQLSRLQFIQNAINKLNIPDLSFVLIPYKNNRKSLRMIQLSVVRRSALDRVLKEEESFFAQFGLVPGADPNTVVTMIENADRYERNRAYGYLFGYPSYAVDFFVESVHKAEVTKSKIESRNFFQIPAYGAKEGTFVYAYPENYTLQADVDSVIYNKAMKVLNEYTAVRNSYLNPDSTLRANSLILDFINKK